VTFASSEDLIAAFGRGEVVIVVDDADRENEGDLIVAADMITEEQMAFMIRHTSGIICLPMEEDRLDQLQLPQMVRVNTDRRHTAFTQSIDAREGVSTGISANDRTQTVRVAIAADTKPSDLDRPGHIFPLRADPGGVLKRAGHTEAAVDLARLSGRYPAGVLSEIMNDDGSVARLPELERFAKEHGMLIGTIADLIAHRRVLEGKLVERVVESKIPTRHGWFRAVGYRSRLDGREHVAFVVGEIGDGSDVLTRVHSECLTGDVFGSLRCDCGTQLDRALAAVAAEGRGVVLYIRGHEGRGIGLFHKLAAYNLQDLGRDTVQANQDLGLPIDSRDYGMGAQILYDLGVRSMRLLTNNPTKRAGIEGYGLEIVAREPLVVEANDHNRDYLETKQRRMGHVFGSDEDAAGDLGVDEGEGT
jgi:3,4-dihydroxy 2-butanone 4-phosphate synthase / GTP cyclohydrolase II